MVPTTKMTNSATTSIWLLKMVAFTCAVRASAIERRLYVCPWLRRNRWRQNRHITSNGGISSAKCQLLGAAFLTPTCDPRHGSNVHLRRTMALEVHYASPRDCSCFLRDFPGDGCDGDNGGGRRASRQEALQRQVER